MLFALGPLGWTLVGLSGAVTLALVIWAVVDALSSPGEAGDRSGQSKALWVALPVAALAVPEPGLALILAVVYLAAIRPKVKGTQVSPAIRSARLGVADRRIGNRSGSRA